MECKICTHSNRVEIERALMNLGSSISIESIAETYDVPIEDLKIHALFHAPVSISDDASESIVRNLKLRESDMLSEVATEYLITLKGLSRKINGALSEDMDPIVFSRMVNKSLVELYLGVGAEVRKTVSAIAEIDNILNGPKEDNTSGLAALVSAINASK